MKHIYRIKKKNSRSPKKEFINFHPVSFQRNKKKILQKWYLHKGKHFEKKMPLLKFWAKLLLICTFLSIMIRLQPIVAKKID
jgi:hypothetical protein